MKVFVLQNQKAGRGKAVTDFLPADGARMADAPRCPVCGRFLGMLRLLPPGRAELDAWGSRWGDVAFGPGDQILVSDKLKNLFTEAGLTGFARFDPVEIVNLRKRNSSAGDAPKYWLASIQRSQATLDEAASGLVRDETSICEECRIGGIVKRVNRIVLEASMCPSEDVFFARGLPGTILVSERFKRLCETNDLVNCALIPAENFSFDHYPQEP